MVSPTRFQILLSFLNCNVPSALIKLRSMRIRNCIRLRFTIKTDKRLLNTQICTQTFPEGVWGGDRDFCNPWLIII